MDPILDVTAPCFCTYVFTADDVKKKSKFLENARSLFFPSDKNMRLQEKAGRLSELPAYHSKRRKRKYFLSATAESINVEAPLKHATYLAFERMTIPRSGCNTGERGTRPDCIPAASAASPSVCPTFLRRSRWRLFGQPVDRADGRWNTGATNSTIQYYNPGNGNIPPAQVQSSDSATYQARYARPVRPLSFPLYLASPLDIPGVSLSTGRCLYRPPPPRVPFARFPLAGPTLPAAAFRLRSIAFRLGSTSPSDYI